MPAKKKVAAETAEVIDTPVEAVAEEKPAKKTRKTTKKAAAETAEEKPAKKTTRKTAAKKTAEETAAEEKPAKKTRKTTKKAAAETAEEKPAKKTTRKTTKKTAKKAEETVEAPVAEAPVVEAPAAEEAPAAVETLPVSEYEDKINWKKGEAHAADWLYIELNAQDLLNEFEAGVDNTATVCTAMMNTMLEGDEFLCAEEDKNTAAMTVRYYTDNLSADRKKYFEA